MIRIVLPVCACEMQECPLMAAGSSALLSPLHCVEVCVCVCGLGYMNHSLSQWGGGVCTDRESRCSLLLEDTQSTQRERERGRRINEDVIKTVEPLLWWISVKPQVKMRKCSTDTQSLYICTNSSQPWMEKNRKQKKRGKKNSHHKKFSTIFMTLFKVKQDCYKIILAYHLSPSIYFLAKL